MTRNNRGGMYLFIQGVSAPFGAMGFVRRNRGLAVYFIVPFFINLLLLSALIYFSITCIYPLLMQFMPQGGAWYHTVVRWVVTPLFGMLLALISIVLYSVTGGIVTAPFNDPLAGRVEAIITGRSFEEKFTVSGMVRDLVRVFSSVIKLLIIIVIFNVVILLLNLIPVIGSVLYAVLGFLSGMFFLGFGFIEFPLDRRKLGFSQKLKIAWRYRFLTVGIGTGFWIQAFIPIIGFLSLNLSAVGATRLYVDYIKPGLDTSREAG